MHSEIYKVGFSTNLLKRLRVYQTGKLEDIDVVYVYKTDNCQAVERCVKSLVEGYRLDNNKEIYQLSLDVLKSIMNGCGKLSMKLEYKMKGPTKTDGQFYAVIG